MKLEEQVTNLELSKRLKELGYPQESLWYWVVFYNNSSSMPLKEYEQLVLAEYLQDEFEKGFLEIIGKYSAPTVAELGEKLPKEYSRSQKYKDYWLVWSQKYPMSKKANAQANAYGEMVAYLLEKELIKL